MELLERLDRYGFELSESGVGTSPLAKGITLVVAVSDWGNGELRVDEAHLSGPGLTHSVSMPGVYGDDGTRLARVLSAFAVPDYGNN